MISRHKPPIIILLAVAIFYCACAVLANAESSPPEPVVDLTIDERAWLKAHPHIRMVHDLNYEPFLIASEDGSVSGILKDLIDLLNHRLGTDIEIVAVDLETAIEMWQRGEVDGSPGQSPEASKHWNMLSTRPHFTVYPALFAGRDKIGVVNSLKDLAGQRCAIVGGLSTIEKIVEPYEDQLTIVRANSTDHALKMLFEGQVDFFLGYSTNTYQIATNNFTGLVPVLVLSDRRIDAVMGVRKDWPELVGILNKGLASITEPEKLRILARWSAMPWIGPSEVTLSDAEKAWLTAHPRVVLGTDASWVPLVIDGTEGSPTGVDVDFINLLNQKLGTKIELRLGRWPEMVQKAKDRQIDGLASSAPLDKRRAYFHFSDAYHTTYKSIFTRSDEDFGIDGLQALTGRRVAIAKGNAFDRQLLENVPQVEIVEVAPRNAIVNHLLRGDVDAAISGPGLYFKILQEEIVGIKMQHLIIDRPISLVYSIRRDWPELLGIINKGLSAISPVERQQILSKYWGEEQLDTYRLSFDLSEQEKAWLARGHVVRVSVMHLPPFDVRHHRRFVAGEDDDGGGLIGLRVVKIRARIRGRQNRMNQVGALGIGNTTVCRGG